MFLPLVSVGQKPTEEGEKQEEVEDKEKEEEKSLYAIPPFTERDSLGADIEILMSKTSSNTADSIRVGIQGVVSGGLSEKQADLLYSVSKKMYAKRYKVNKDFENFYACIVAGASEGKISDQQLTRFLEIADTSVTYYPRKTIKNFFHRTRTFLEDTVLYESGFYKITVEKGSFEFGHIMDDGFAKDDHILAQPEGNAEEEEKEEWFEHLEGDDEDSGDENMDGDSEEIVWGDDSPDNANDTWGDDSSMDNADSEDIVWHDEGDNWGDEWSDGDGSDVEEYQNDEGWSDDWSEEEESHIDETEDVEPEKKRERVGFADIKSITEWDEDCSSEFTKNVFVELPPVLGPFLTIKNVDLRMESKLDTVVLENVTGSLLFQTDTVVVHGGKMYWHNIGHAKDSVYCVLPNYAFDVRRPSIKVDKAEMYYKNCFDSLVVGYYEYKPHIDNHKSDKAIYPRFKSYESDIRYETHEGIELKGGFTIKGRRITTESFSYCPSILKVSEGDSIQFKASSEAGFVYGDSIIYSPKSAVKMFYAGNDSITHPEVSIRYKINESKVAFRKSKGLMRYSPFYFSLHKLNMDTEFFQWDLKADSIDIKTLNAGNKVPTYIESDRFFHPGKFERLQGLRRFHPLVMIYGYAYEIKSKVFTASELAKARNVDESQFKDALVMLMFDGLIQYNPITDEILLKDKGILYYQAYKQLQYLSKRPDASLRTIADFDNLSVASLIQKAPNATLNLKDSTLKVRGVSKMSISDSLNVKVYPSDGEMVFKENKDMTFGGQLVSGNLVFAGSRFDFEYDSFKVSLTSIDSVSFLLKDESGEQQKAPNSIVNTGGILYISEPHNKSGLLKEPPRFHAEQGGRMDFDRQVNPNLNSTTIRKLPKRKRVYFDIPEIDVENTNEELKTTFGGTFHSGGIFRPFQDTVKLNFDDNSFGFLRPFEVYPLYGMKGTYSGDLNLKANGLRGEGDVEYLGSTFSSKDFRFYTDSITTIGNLAKIESEIHPRVDMDSYHMRWFVEQDSMVFTSEEGTPFQLYGDHQKGENEILFKGTLALMPKRVSGNGRIETKMSINESRDIRLQKNHYESYKSKFSIMTSYLHADTAMVGDGVSVKRDLLKNTVDFSKESKRSEMRFPNTMYKTNIDRAKWVMDEKKIYMTEDEGRKGDFHSVHPKQGNLLIKGTNAIYDLEEYSLTVKGVDAIRVANASVVPNEEQVVIREGAVIDTLQKATVIFNAFTKYHTIRNADITITSRKNFDGEGDYEYTNSGGEKSLLHFDRFRQPEKRDQEGHKVIQTIAYGNVEEEDAFLFKPGIKYAGKIKLVDSRRYMAFSGKIKLNTARDELWFKYESKNEDADDINQPDTIAPVIVDENLKIASVNQKPKVGIYLGNDSKELIGAFMEYDEMLGKSREVLETTGELKYNKNSNSYSITPQAILDKETEKGNRLEFFPDKNRIDFTGKMELIRHKSKDKFALHAAGIGSIDTEKMEFDTKAALILQIPFDQKAIRQLIGDFERTEESEKINEAIDKKNLDEMVLLMNQLLNDEDMPEMVDEAELVVYDFAQSIKNGIAITDVNLTWNEEYSSFISVNKVGVIGTYGVESNQLFDAIIEIPKAEEKDSDYVCKMLLKSREIDTWYYFAYTKNGVKVYSSNKAFNLSMEKVKGDVALETAENIISFFDMFSGKYLDDEPPFKLDISIKSELNELEGEDGLDESLEDMPIDDSEEDDGGF